MSRWVPAYTPTAIPTTVATMAEAFIERLSFARGSRQGEGDQRVAHQRAHRRVTSGGDDDELLSARV
jgi:hypothetical protein